MNMSKNICKPQVEDLLSIQTSWNALVLLLASTKNICLTSSPPQGPLLHSQFSLNGWSEIILVSKVEALKRWNHIFLQLINFYRNSDNMMEAESTTCHCCQHQNKRAVYCGVQCTGSDCLVDQNLTKYLFFCSEWFFFSVKYIYEFQKGLWNLISLQKFSTRN